MEATGTGRPPYDDRRDLSRRTILHIALVGAVQLAVIVGAVVLVVVTVDSREESARDTADRIAKAVSDNDFEALCELYTDSGREEALDTVHADDCQEFGRDRVRASRGVGVDMKIVDVEEHGESATVTYSVRSGVDEQTHELELVREDGDWRMKTVADFDPRDRPTRSDLAQLFSQVPDLDDDTADCMADALYDSDLTDEQLQALFLDDLDALEKDEAEELLDVARDVAIDCGVADVAG